MDASTDEPLAEQPAQGEDVAIDWGQAREANRANWNDRAAVHEQAYGIEAFVDDPQLVSGQVRSDAEVLAQHLPSGTVQGLDLLHLQCHIGTDTLSWARLGARVTGLDLSPASLDVARGLAERAGTRVRWVESDALSAREAVQGDFDVVYTSIGALCWLNDLDRWAQQVAALLRPGGVFYVQDGHPMMYALEEQGEHPRVMHRYFGNGTASAWDDEGTYVGDGKVSHQRTYEWPHPLSEVIGSLLGAGLVLERFDEGQTLPWRFSSAMVESPEGWRWPHRDLVPCTFTVVARRPR